MLAVVAALLSVVPAVSQVGDGGADGDPAAATDYELVQDEFDEIYDQANPPISEDDGLIQCLYDPARLLADSDTLQAAENDPNSNFSLDQFGLRRSVAPVIDEGLVEEATFGDLGITELEVAAPTGDDPVDLALQLSEFGIFAAPDYQMFPTPRHYFPGSFPVPRTPSPALSYAAPDGEHTVHVLDTGIDLDQGYAVNDVLVGGHTDDDPEGASEDDPLVATAPLDYVGGHGAFVAGVLAQQAPGIGLQVRAVSPASSAPSFFESDFINAAAGARVRHDSDNDTGPMLTNLSLGVSNCHTFGDLDEAGQSLPIGTFRAVTRILLREPGDMYLAAAGNSGDDQQITYPAAFFKRPSTAGLEADLLDQFDTRTIESLEGQTLAVGASDHGRIAEYSTRGGWVDVYAEGCHVADYPRGTFDYPSASGNPSESREFTTGAAQWCGSSFATPLVAGLIASAWMDGVDFATAKANVLAQATDVDGSLILGDLAFAPGVNQVTDSSAADAIDTATDTCQLLFPRPDEARSVLLARVGVFADALAGSPLARDDSCILFTPSDTLDSRTETEIDRVLPEGGLVRILGGEVAVSAEIEAQLQETYSVERFGGVTRVQTATAIADAVLAENPGQTEAMIAYARDFPDAVTGGAYGAQTGTPVLLSDTEVLHPDTRLWLEANEITTGYLLGGTAVLGNQVEAQAGLTILNNDPVAGQVQRVAGPNRMGTAAAVASQLWGPVNGGSPENLVVLDLERPDAWNVALSSAPLSALCDAPQLGVRAAGTPIETGQYLLDQSFGQTPTVLMMGPARDDGLIASAVDVP